jgi:hypothetical protein
LGRAAEESSRLRSFKAQFSNKGKDVWDYAHPFVERVGVSARGALSCFMAFAELDLLALEVAQVSVSVTENQFF